MDVQLLDDESVVDEQYARYGRQWFRPSGKIFLTDKRLIFRPRRNLVGPSAEPRIIDLDRIVALGREHGGWIANLFVWGRNADSWFVDVDGERHWFDLGFGWNKTWLEKLARRLGLAVAVIDER